MAINQAPLTTNPDVQDLLMTACDFQVGHGATWFSIDGVDHFEVVATDGGGGVFVVTPSSPCVLYVSSEGQAGVVAADFDELLTLVVLCPYWRDLLSASRGGDIEAMREAVPRLEEMCIDDEIDDARSFLKAELEVQEPDDLVGQLHRMVSTSGFVVRAPDGNTATSLF